MIPVVGSKNKVNMLLTGETSRMSLFTWSLICVGPPSDLRDYNIEIFDLVETTRNNPKRKIFYLYDGEKRGS